jgi:hypothetical protein
VNRGDWYIADLVNSGFCCVLALSQVQDSRLGGNNYSGLRHAFRSIIEREGFRALYTV